MFGAVWVPSSNGRWAHTRLLIWPIWVAGWNNLAAEHPESARLTDALTPIFCDDRVTISSGTTRLRAIIKTPNGRRELA